MVNKDGKLSFGTNGELKASSQYCVWTLQRSTLEYGTVPILVHMGWFLKQVAPPCTFVLDIKAKGTE